MKMKLNKVDFNDVICGVIFTTFLAIPVFAEKVSPPESYKDKELNEYYNETQVLDLNEVEKEVQARIRHEIVANQQLSDVARNIIITVEDDSVVLSGPVMNQDESIWIEDTAKRVATEHTVVNKLRVTG